MGSIIDRIFKEIDAAKAKKETAPVPTQPKEEEEPKVEATEPKIGKPIGIFELLFNGIRAAKDVMSPPKERSVEETVKEAEDYRGSKIVTGEDFIYTVPTHIKQLRVQILEPNGRLKNEYTLTNYLAIKGGDKFRIIAD